MIFLSPLPLGFLFWCHLPCPDDERAHYLLWGEGGRGEGERRSVDRESPGKPLGHRTLLCILKKGAPYTGHGFVGTGLVVQCFLKLSFGGALLRSR